MTDIEEGDIVSYYGDLYEFQKGMGKRTTQHLRGYTIEKHERLIKEKDQEINALQIAHVKQESDNMVLRTYLKEVYDVLDRYQAFQLSGKTEEERAKETSTKGGNER